MKKTKLFAILLIKIILTYSVGVGETIIKIPSQNKTFLPYLISQNYNYSLATKFYKLPSEDIEYTITFGLLHEKDNFFIDLSYLKLEGNFISSEGRGEFPYRASLLFSYLHILADKESQNNLVMISSANISSLRIIDSTLYGISFSIGLSYFDTLPLIGEKEEKCNFSLATSIEEIGINIYNGNNENLDSKVCALIKYEFLALGEWLLGISSYLSYKNTEKTILLGVELRHSLTFSTSFKYDILNSIISFDNYFSINLGKQFLRMFYTLGLSELGSETSVGIEFDF